MFAHLRRWLSFLLGWRINWPVISVEGAAIQYILGMGVDIC